MHTLEFKQTITKKGYFYFIREYEGNKTLGFIRVSEDKFKHIKAGMSDLYNFFTKHKEGVKTEHYFSGRVVHKLVTLGGNSYF